MNKILVIVLILMTPIFLIISYPIIAITYIPIARLFEMHKNPILMKTGGFELRIRDKNTGLPIPGVLVKINWYKYFILGLEGAGSHTVKEMVVLSDANGNVPLPFLTSVHLWSVFNTIDYKVNHPLYGAHFGSLYRSAYASEKRDLSEPIPQVEQSLIQNKTFTELKLLSLSDKYRDAKCVELAPQGNKRDVVCEGKGNELFSDIRTGRYYFDELVEAENLNADRNIIPQKEDARKTWLSIAEKVYSSPVNPLVSSIIR